MSHSEKMLLLRESWQDSKAYGAPFGESMKEAFEEAEDYVENGTRSEWLIDRQEKAQEEFERLNGVKKKQHDFHFDFKSTPPFEFYHGGPDPEYQVPPWMRQGYYAHRMFYEQFARRPIFSDKEMEEFRQRMEALKEKINLTDWLKQNDEQKKRRRKDENNSKPR